MDKQSIKNLIVEASKTLYLEKLGLMAQRTHERTITSHLEHYLSQLFQGWDVDNEYNRQGDEGEAKRSLNMELLLPDIIIHRRGSVVGPNLVAIQVKGYWNNEDRAKDESDLRKLRDKYRYKFLFRLELLPSTFQLTEIS